MVMNQPPSKDAAKFASANSFSESVVATLGLQQPAVLHRADLAYGAVGCACDRPRGFGHRARARLESAGEEVVETGEVAGGVTFVLRQIDVVGGHEAFD